MGCEYIGVLASGVYDEIGTPSNISISYISGKMVSSGFLGLLTVQVDTCHYIESGCIVPPLDEGEQAIYQLLYQNQYYNRRAIESLGAIGATQWVEVTEGDSRIRRSNPAEIAKFFRDLSNSTSSQLSTMIDLYKRNQALPRSVNFYSIDQNGNNSSCSDYRAGPFY